MRTSKKILAILLSLIAVVAVSAMVSTPIYFIFGFPFWPMVCGVSGLFIIANYLSQYWQENKIIKAEFAKLKEKPYQDFLIDSTCQYCGHRESIRMDLNSLEYKCTQCKKTNAIYISFMTAAVTEPPSLNML